MYLQSIRRQGKEGGSEEIDLSGEVSIPVIHRSGTGILIEGTKLDHHPIIPTKGDNGRLVVRFRRYFNGAYHLGGLIT